VTPSFSKRGRTIETDRPAIFIPVLALVAVLLLAVCGWRFLRPGRPTVAAADADAHVDRPIAAGSRRDPLPPETTVVPTSSPDRTLSASIGSPDPLSTAAAASVRPETLVRGRLLDASHAPIGAAASAEVRFVDRSGRRRSFDAKREGTYALRELDFGTYWVTASADGYRDAEERVELHADRPVMEKDFTLQKAVELRIRVTTPDGRNLLDVLKETSAPRGTRLLVPVATREMPGRRFEEVAGSLNHRIGVGRFEDRGPRVETAAPGGLGVLLLDCDLPVCVSLVHFQAVLQTRRVVTSEDEVTFVVSPEDLLADLATLRIRVIDAESGLAIPRARVTLGGGACFDPGVATDPEGIATIERREPGRFDLKVAAGGYELFRRPVDALPGELTDLGTVALEKEATVEGRVLDLEDHPVAASFSLGIVDPEDHSIHWFRGEEFASSGAGHLEIRGLGRKAYVLRTNNHDLLGDGGWRGVTWVSGNVPLDTRDGSIAGLEIHLQPASRLVLRDVAGGAGDAMRFRVADELGQELVAGLLHGSEPRPLALPVGSYVVWLLDARGEVLSKRAVTLGSETLGIDLAR
jgi:hypothetical protein